MIPSRSHSLMSPGETEENFEWINSHRGERRLPAGREIPARRVQYTGLYSPSDILVKINGVRALAPGTYGNMILQ